MLKSNLLNYMIKGFGNFLKLSKCNSFIILFTLNIFICSGQRIDPYEIYGEPEGYDNDIGYPKLSLYWLWVVAATVALYFLVMFLINLSEKPFFKYIYPLYLFVVIVWLVGCLLSIFVLLSMFYYLVDT